MSIGSAKKPKKGRPRIDSEAINLRLDRSRLATLDSWRQQQPDLPNRPEAIRRLIELGLKAEKSDGPATK